MQTNKSMKPAKNNTLARPKPQSNKPNLEAKIARFRGQKNDYARQSKISPDGADWLVAAIDPFHDFQRQIAGYPDMDGSASVVACTTTQFEIAAPGAVAWDCNVFTLPIARSGNGRAFDYANHGLGKVTQSALTAVTAFAPLNAISVNAGLHTFPDTKVWNPAGLSTINHSITDATAGAVSRMVGWGIEVINTSPELNKSGMITVYRVPQRKNRSTVQFVDATAGNLIQGSTSLVRLCRPPCTSAEAALLPHSASWEAKDGAYVPVSMNGIDNPAQQMDYHAVSFGDQVFQGFGNAAYEAGLVVTGAAAVTDPMPAPQRILPYDTVGVYLTNLDPKSTFTVRMKVYFEKFPGTSDDVLLPMCTPSPRYDQHALALYSELIHDLPVGTKSDNNANGDWFKNVLRILRMVGTPVASLFPGVGSIFGGVMNVADTAVSGLGRIFPRMP